MFDERSPIYVQIAQQIKEEIISGTLHEEEQVMSTTQYALFYRINPATAAKGFHQLVDEGILYKKRGIGMFVARNVRERLMKERRERFFEEIVAPMIEEAFKIGVPLGDIVSRINKLEEEAHEHHHRAE